MKSHLKQVFRHSKSSSGLATPTSTSQSVRSHTSTIAPEITVSSHPAPTANLLASSTDQPHSHILSPALVSAPFPAPPSTEQSVVPNVTDSASHALNVASAIGFSGAQHVDASRSVFYVADRDITVHNYQPINRTCPRIEEMNT
jgi:hypothetical protein